ncbi:MAG: hypothetical protein UGF38_01235, partial [Ruminococcus sp.]|nr:hypothetical protein [Ruminococcus sp.]
MIQQFFKSAGEVWASSPHLRNKLFLRLVANYEPQATKKFFDPAIFQKCWRGSGRAALIAARRQRNPCA